ncbi:MAG: AAA family ATPase, partial [Planctomycetes bacterium]|nr:AAA family ATPase [Planctomycetota bacterium]
ETADGSKEFTFVRGPLFANMILADEINRAPSRTQAALLEAMQEHSVTVGRRSYALEEPFFVLATQNPIEQEGTYPLPEAQQDRFMFFLQVRYPEADEEVDVLKRTTTPTMPHAEPVMSGEDILEIQRLVRGVPIADHLTRYASRLARISRLDRGDEGNETIPDFVKEYVEWGSGPRAGQYLVLGGKARAFLDGRSHVSAEDIRAVAYPVLRHRIIVNFAAQAEGIDSSWVIGKLLDHVAERTD